MTTIRLLLMLLHVLAGAAWFGSMFYSIFVLYPRLSRYMGDITERERFLLALSHGARWHMIAAISLVALSGIGLALSPREQMTAAWLTLIGVKTALLIASAAFFWRISWHWWPARLFALETELPAIHRRFRVGAVCMLLMVGANAVVGVISRTI
jgi:uncharacterized membrane protein